MNTPMTSGELGSGSDREGTVHPCPYCGTDFAAGIGWPLMRRLGDQPAEVIETVRRG